MRRYGFNSIGINFLLSVVVIQWALLINGFFESAHEDHLDRKLEFDIVHLIKADFAAGAVLVSFGAVLGHATPLQLVAVAFLEVIFFGVNEMIGDLELKAVDMGGKSPLPVGQRPARPTTRLHPHRPLPTCPRKHFRPHLRSVLRCLVGHSSQPLDAAQQAGAPD